MVKEQLEIERKFEVDDTFVLPALSIVDGVAKQGKPRQFELESTYFDTADLRLAAARVTLRRRTGGEDEGWHLKLPVAADERREVHVPLGAGRRIPVALSRLVRVHVRDQRLLPIATMRTVRVVRPLLGGKGRELAEVCDDKVSVTTPDGADGWREIEVELVDGERTLLDAVGARLIEAGARPASSSSKLARTLGSRIPAAEAPPAGSSAGSVVMRYVMEQVGALRSCDAGVREEAEDAVHQMRVAIRRLRSTLATYRKLFNREVTDPIRDELRWLGNLLGPARDLEVVRERLDGLLADDGVANRGLQTLVDRDLTARRREARRHLLAELDGPRYFRLLDALDSLVGSPPFTEIADGSAKTVLPKPVHRSWKRLRRAHDAAVEPDLSDAERDRRLHEARKAAKRARYAAEAATARFGKPARKFGARMKKLQTVLGHVQDSVVSAAELSSLTTLAGDSFALGRAQALEEERGRRALAKFESAWSQAAAPKLRRWLR
ncbi:MAG: CYTH and CHAD domain-containing protein [Geodermatophilaceae bacterium]|nr:CYTH and CHAD domain-containing protein [Geodermatophilaceae bacterium]